jgi:type IV secretion system protein VirD4
MIEKRLLGRLALFFVVLEIFAVGSGLWLGAKAFVALTNLPSHFASFSLLIDIQQNLAVMALAPKHAIFFKVALAIAGSIALLPVILFGIGLFALRSKEELFGSARYARSSEIAKAGMIRTARQPKPKYPEILIGKMMEGPHKGELIRFAGQQFVMVGAPTRSGKGIGLVIPNLLNYYDSTVSLDIKLELFKKTAGFRKKYQAVFLFSPDGYFITPDDAAKGLARSHRWNPLSYIRRQPVFRDGDVMQIAKILYPTRGGKNDIWNEMAAGLFKGLVLYLLDKEEQGGPVPTMQQVFRLLTPEGGLSDWMKKEMSVAKDNGRPLSEGCVAEFNRFVAAPVETSGSILTNCSAPLFVFAEAICGAATSGDDFDLRDVRRKRMSIYVGISPDNLPKYDKLLNLFFSQLIAVNTQTLPEQDSSLKYQCLIVLDEFTSMGYVDIIAKSIAYTAGYNMRYLIICQGRAQLENPDLYGREGAANLIDNCAVQVIFPPKEVNEQAKRVSETLGYKTVKSKSKTRTLGKTLTGTENISDQRRALMLPQELVELGTICHPKAKTVAIKELIIAEKIRPFITNKIISFDEPIFIERQTYAEQHPVDIPLLKLATQPQRVVVEPAVVSG